MTAPLTDAATATTRVPADDHRVAAALMRGYRMGMVAVIGMVVLFNILVARGQAVPLSAGDGAYLLGAVGLLGWEARQAVAGRGGVAGPVACRRGGRRARR